MAGPRPPAPVATGFPPRPATSRDDRPLPPRQTATSGSAASISLARSSSARALSRELIAIAAHPVSISAMLASTMAACGRASRAPPTQASSKLASAARHEASVPCGQLPAAFQIREIRLRRDRSLVVSVRSSSALNRTPRLAATPHAMRPSSLGSSDTCSSAFHSSTTWPAPFIIVAETATMPLCDNTLSISTRGARSKRRPSGPQRHAFGLDRRSG